MITGSWLRCRPRGAKIAPPNLASFRDAVKPLYARAREKYGAEVDAFIADPEVVRKALPAK